MKSPHAVDASYTSFDVEKDDSSLPIEGRYRAAYGAGLNSKGPVNGL